MFNTLKEWFEATLGGESGDESSREHTLELAAAVLMLEIGLADSDVQEEELEVIRRAMQTSFHLDAGETEEIIGLARQEVDHAISLHDFTQLVLNSLSIRDRARIIELLWRVAYADAVLNKYEEYYIRKIADLLHVPHSAFIRAKHRASE